MKPELTQEEFAALTKQGKTAIWQFATLYHIDYSHNLGNGEFYLRLIHRNPKGQNVSLRGRFHAMEPERARTFIKFS